MKLHTIKANKGSRSKSWRIGRGNGAGTGTFSGRGSKGFLARSGGRKRPGFEGGQTPLIRKLPKAKGFTSQVHITYQVVNVETLNTFDDGTTIDTLMLHGRNLVSKKNAPLKILGHGEISKKLNVVADSISASAREKIEKAGGTVTVPEKRRKNKHVVVAEA
ncbi:MAG: 50S ribosomal protein L15 [Patescibacteria group bacterium]